MRTSRKRRRKPSNGYLYPRKLIRNQDVGDISEFEPDDDMPEWAAGGGSDTT